MVNKITSQFAFRIGNDYSWYYCGSNGEVSDDNWKRIMTKNRDGNKPLSETHSDLYERFMEFPEEPLLGFVRELDSLVGETNAAILEKDRKTVVNNYRRAYEIIRIVDNHYAD